MLAAVFREEHSGCRPGPSQWGPSVSPQIAVGPWGGPCLALPLSGFPRPQWPRQVGREHVPVHWTAGSAGVGLFGLCLQGGAGGLRGCVLHPGPRPVLCRLQAGRRAASALPSGSRGLQRGIPRTRQSPPSGASPYAQSLRGAALSQRGMWGGVPSEGAAGLSPRPRGTHACGGPGGSLVWSEAW